DLLRSKRLDPLAREDDRAYRLVLAQQRNAESGTLASQRDRLTYLVVRIIGHIQNLHGPPLKRDPAGNTATVYSNRMSLQELDILVREANGRARPIHAPFPAQDECHLGITQSRRGLHQSIQDRLQIECRATDDL